MKAILLEHNEEQQTVIRNLLVNNGVDVLLVSHAGDIWQLVKNEGVDFIVADFAMPDLDIKALLKEIKAYNQGLTKSVQIAITTASVDGDLSLLNKFLKIYIKPGLNN